MFFAGDGVRGGGPGGIVGGVSVSINLITI